MIKNNDAAAPASPLRLSVRVFGLFMAIYLCSWGGHYTTGDGAIKVAWAKAMFLGQTAENGSSQNAVISKYGIGHSLLAVPPLAAAHFIQKITKIRCEAA